MPLTQKGTNGGNEAQGFKIYFDMLHFLLLGIFCMHLNKHFNNIGGTEFFLSNIFCMCLNTLKSKTNVDGNDFSCFYIFCMQLNIQK